MIRVAYFLPSELFLHMNETASMSNVRILSTSASGVFKMASTSILDILSISTGCPYLSLPQYKVGQCLPVMHARLRVILKLQMKHKCYIVYLLMSVLICGSSGLFTKSLAATACLQSITLFTILITASLDYKQT